MADKEMTMAEFDALAFAHGPDVAAWPAERQAAAQALARGSAQADARLDEMLALEADLTLAAPATAAPSADLIARILADAAEATNGVQAALSPRPSAPRGRIARLWDWIADIGSPAAACAASAALGLWLGYAGPIDLAATASSVLDDEASVEFSMLDDLTTTPFADALNELETVE